ncbi:MAG TPA: 3-methyl-2-oxobutanoate hydroxymethyltransferase, partial [Acidimicrobiales bacterium]|nr:3-methyl-2-oxobutanoate hydroxymethyltransferase [Acidimicrobiales bacterium]
MTAPGSPAAVRQLAAHKCRERAAKPGRVGVKVNLYRGYEVRAVAAAVEDTGFGTDPVECVMVGDSYFMTHLGRPSTRLAPSEREWAMATMCHLVREVRNALDTTYLPPRCPFLIADLPDGSTATREQAVVSAERLVDAGAEAVKLEVPFARELCYIERLTDRGLPVVAHLGYTPQRSELRRFGQSLEEVRALCRLARTARDHGAVAVVLEMTSELVNRLLSTPGPGAPPVYSIFSGRADLGAQSLNVWDSAVRPLSPKRAFPPTACLDPRSERDQYGYSVVRKSMAGLLALVARGEFPPSPWPGGSSDV